MSFDAIRFFEDYGIPYWTEGKNVSPGWINCQCCFCADNSNHMGVNVNKGYAYCWKCGHHDLFSTVTLLANENNVKPILTKYGVLQYNYGNILIEKAVIDINKKVIMPGSDMVRKHNVYLRDRDYDYNYLKHKYKLKGTMHEEQQYKFRIMIPIYYNGRLVSFQGRDISDKQTLRYKACGKNMEAIHHKHILYNLDNCKLNRVIVVEGLFDVFRVGDNCCASFGTGFTSEQIGMLARRFGQVFILYDSESEALAKAEKACNLLNMMGVETYLIILDEGDPGEMSESDIISLKKEVKLY